MPTKKPNVNGEDRGSRSKNEHDTALGVNIAVGSDLPAYWSKWNLCQSAVRTSPAVPVHRLSEMPHIRNVHFADIDRYHRRLAGAWRLMSIFRQQPVSHQFSGENLRNGTNPNDTRDLNEVANLGGQEGDKAPLNYTLVSESMDFFRVES